MAGSKGCSNSQDRRVVLDSSLGWIETSLSGLLAASFFAVSQPVMAQQATSLNGPPVQVQPIASEPGVPAIQYNAGTLNPFPGSAGAGYDGGVDPGLASGGIGPGTGGTGSGGGFVAAAWSQYQGQAVGTGQCVALVQAADPAVGLTRTWTQGGQVEGNTSLQPGTVIATFDSAGHYANALDGSSHAAIYLGQNSQGIQVLDQWAGQAAHYRTIYFDNTSGRAANQGGSFYAVAHG